MFHYKRRVRPSLTSACAKLFWKPPAADESGLSRQGNYLSTGCHTRVRRAVQG